MESAPVKLLFLSHASLSTGFVVGSHQLAKCYAKKYDVYHVSSAVTPYHFLKGKVGIRKLRNSLFPKFKEEFGFTDFIPLVLFPYGVFSWMDKLNDMFAFFYFKLFNIPTKCEVTLIDQPSFIGFYQTYIASKKVFYRPTDIYKNMGGGKYEKHEEKSVEICGGIIATSKEVLDALGSKALSKPNIVVENGVDYEFFSKPRSSAARKGFVYVGAIDFRFDLDFLIKLASLLPNENFDIFGSVSIEINSKKLPNNLSFKGSVDYSIVPGLLHTYRYGLIPLNDHPANVGRSPMKLFEYQAAGLITLVRESAKYKALETDVVLTYDSVETAIEKISDTTSLEHSEYESRLQECAKLESWEIKSQVIENFVGFEN